MEIIKNKSIINQELKEIITDPISDNEDENENKHKKGKKLNRRKKRAPKQDRNIVKTTFEEKNKIQDIPEEAQKKNPQTKTKKAVVKKPKIKPNKKSKATETKKMEKEKIIETETKDIHAELREMKSSSPIEVTQIDENSSSNKPKKKGWWS